MKKHLTRYKVQLDQTVRRTERTDVLSNELHLADAKVDALSSALKNARAKLADCLRSKSSQENLDRRKKKLEEHDLAQTLLGESRQLCELNESSLLGQVMALYSEALSSMVTEQVQTEMEIEKRVLERFSSYSEDEGNIRHLKQKLKNLTLDMDGAKAKLSSALANNSGSRKEEEKISALQEEYDTSVTKVEACKDQVAAEIYKLAAKEVEMANIFSVIVDTQLEYHRSALAILTETAPLISEKIDSYPRRPVYGCALEDHLRYSGRQIALVIEVCCAGIAELGLDIEGLFRISGNQAKVRRIKAAFDAGEVDLTDMETDPHAIAGALKLYLRELPDPITKSSLYNEWIGAMTSSRAPSDRLAALGEVIAKLPPPNYANLRFLIRFLAELVNHSEANKMTHSNVAIVMAPNIIWSPMSASHHGQHSFQSSNSGALLVEFLLAHAVELFPGEFAFHNHALVATLISGTGGFQDASSGGVPPRIAGINSGDHHNYNMNHVPGSHQYGWSPLGNNVSGGGPPKPLKPKAPAPPPPPMAKKPSPRREVISSPDEGAAGDWGDRPGLYPQLSEPPIYDDVDITSSDSSPIGSSNEMLSNASSARNSTPGTGVGGSSAARRARIEQKSGNDNAVHDDGSPVYMSIPDMGGPCHEPETGGAKAPWVSLVTSAGTKKFPTEAELEEYLRKMESPPSGEKAKKVVPERPPQPARKSDDSGAPVLAKNQHAMPVAKPRKLKPDGTEQAQEGDSTPSFANRKSMFEVSGPPPPAKDFGSLGKQAGRRFEASGVMQISSLSLNEEGEQGEEPVVPTREKRGSLRNKDSGDGETGDQKSGPESTRL